MSDVLARPISQPDIPMLRAFLASAMPMSAHVAGVLEAMNWSAERVASCVHGSWMADELHTVILMGQVLRVVSTEPELSPALVDLLSARLTPDTQAVMGTEDVVQALHERIPGAKLRSFAIWERGTGTTRVERVRPPAPAELPAFATASYQAFVEELGCAPTEHSQDEAYLDLWERARQRGRILGAWDADARCIFRIEIRPALGLVAELRGLWLDPELRGAGLGRALLDETVGYVTTNIASRVQVIADTEHGAAAHLYRSAGFTVVGRLARLELPRVGG